MVLNNRPGSRISSEAREKVLSSARKLNYRPNLSAQALKTTKTKMIGFVSDEVATTRFASGLIRGALAEAAKQGYLILVMETNGNLDVEQEAFDVLADRHVEDVIFASMRAREIPLPSVTSKTRIVMLNATNERYGLTVLPDEYSGGKLAAISLVTDAKQHRIALIGKNRRVEESIFDSITIPKRLAGIYDALDSHGVKLELEVETSSWNPEDGYLATLTLLKGRPDINSIICMNDRLAFGAYQAIAEMGLKIPNDVKLVSFDDDEIAQHLKPGLTTVALPHEEMGIKAVQLLLGQEQSATVLVPMQLVTRESI
jgi:LacI family transcriptional regulator